MKTIYRQEDIIKFINVLFPSVKSDNILIERKLNVSYVKVDSLGLDGAYLSDIVEAANTAGIKCEEIFVYINEGHLTFEI